MILLKTLRSKRIKEVKYIMLAAVALIALTVAIIIIINSIGVTVKVEAGEVDLYKIFDTDYIELDRKFNRDNFS